MFRNCLRETILLHDKLQLSTVQNYFIEMINLIEIITKAIEPTQDVCAKK